MEERSFKVQSFFKNLVLFFFVTTNQLVYYFWVMTPDKEQSDRWNTAQKVLVWIEIAIQLCIQLLIFYQLYRYTPDEIMHLIGIERSFKEEGEDYMIQLPEEVLDKKFRLLFILLTLALAVTHGYANLKVENSVNQNHYQLFVYSIICICNWYEAKMYLGKFDIIIGSLGYLLSALIDVGNKTRQEIFFIFISYGFFFLIYFYIFLFQQYGITLQNEQPNNAQYLQKTPLDPKITILNSQDDEAQNRNLINQEQLDRQGQSQSIKKVTIFQFPFSQSINLNSVNTKKISQFTFDPFQYNNTRKTVQNGLNTLNENILDNKISKILNSFNQNSQPNKIQSFQDSINQHLQFYQGMIDKLDSAIFVIGGPNKVFESLNKKAQVFFQPYFLQKGIEDSLDYKSIFDLINLKDFSKSCYSYLETLGISKIQIPCPDSPMDTFQKKGTLASFQFQQNQGISNHSQFQKQNSPFLSRQAVSQKSQFNFNYKTQQSTLSQDQNINNEEFLNKLTLQDSKRLKKMYTFTEVSLLSLLQKLLENKQKVCMQHEYIEIIEFTTVKELEEILRFVQIKIYGFKSNGDDFLFIQFVKNQEREEMMRQTIHKDIQYNTFKTLSHELGTSINFMLLLLDSAIVDKSISQKCKEDYIFNLYNNSQMLNCIIQDIRDYHNHLNGGLKVQIKSTQLKSLIINTCLIFSQMIKMKEIDLEFLISSDVPQIVFTDKQKIQQILIHLIHNAIKFSKQNASICVSVSLIQDELTKQKIVCINVADIGVGMDEEEQLKLRQLLDNIYQSQKVSKHSSGFGFGLTISNILAKKLYSTHNSFYEGNAQASYIQKEEYQPGIHFTSKKNVGSEFRFYINATDSEKLVENSISSAEKNILKSKTQKFRINEYEYFEHEDDIEISKKEYAQQNVEVKVADHLSEIDATFSVQRSLRPLSKKITQVFEKIQNTNNQKQIEKSKFGIGFDPLLLKKTNTIQQDNQTDTNNNKLTVGRKGQKKITLSYLINSQFSKKSITFNQNDDVEEDVQVGVMPVFTKNVQTISQCYKILIVDDEMMNIFGLKMMFKILGVDQGLLLQANNGEEALNIFKQNILNENKQSQIKLIVMDINMPIMDGIQATIEINNFMNQLKGQNTDFLETNIVACSSYDDYDTKQECMNAGMISYISKPCNKEQLTHIIQKYYLK
ncbi:response regulator receiver domain protein (macronuclear) [Tetrahymena thermophila SB210]|uniref:Response regulator receiver domain protein n=1 Tax=Tetrahymena thermophila (strain SB210) TaxID=312017 RepID=I7M1P0_TETTS|nr:response regulator receiver domain protein [Tetrahymena thermophila SB210]EAR97267.2 response regulator receiver domain protein [Tetrahymena thermophila SB210]|eukprot:XP_001017512.2 response regulator receiver domain protein [Tetrahymena thermophila SB210]